MPSAYQVSGVLRRRRRKFDCESAEATLEKLVILRQKGFVDILLFFQGARVEESVIRDRATEEGVSILFDEANRAPSTSRSGWGTVADVARGPGDSRVSVWKPGNPEDRFE